MIRRVLAPALAVLLAACGPGGTQRAAGGHPTIVSLNPCADAVLVEVADPAQILALSHYSRDPRASSMDLATGRRLPMTGGTVEEVLALRPDVVIAGTFLPPATRSAFDRLGIRVVSFAIEHDVPQSLAQLRGLARLAGHPQRGERLAARITQALAAAAPPAGELPVPAVMWQSGGIVPGKDALVSDLMRRTGFASHSADMGLRQADHLPLERLLADPPRLILTAGSAGDGEDRMLAHPALDALQGVRRARFAPQLLYCGGPTIIRAAERLAQLRREIAS